VTAAGDELARHGSQSLARWVVLDAAASEPATVAQIARRRGMARQPVQRLADVLVAEGLATFRVNPHHRRARLLMLTPRGRKALKAISVRQEAWADAHGAKIGLEKLERARALIAEIRPMISMPDQPKEARPT
jgi:DNA-binding MarR family transcriptional regulator